MTLVLKGYLSVFALCFFIVTVVHAQESETNALKENIERSFHDFERGSIDLEFQVLNFVNKDEQHFHIDYALGINFTRSVGPLASKYLQFGVGFMKGIGYARSNDVTSGYYVHFGLGFNANGEIRGFSFMAELHGSILQQLNSVGVTPKLAYRLRLGEIVFAPEVGLRIDTQFYSTKILDDPIYLDVMAGVKMGIAF